MAFVQEMRIKLNRTGNSNCNAVDDLDNSSINYGSSVLDETFYCCFGQVGDDFNGACGNYNAVNLIDDGTSFGDIVPCTRTFSCQNTNDGGVCNNTISQSWTANCNDYYMDAVCAPADGEPVLHTRTLDCNCTPIDCDFYASGNNLCPDGGNELGNDGLYDSNFVGGCNGPGTDLYCSPVNGIDETNATCESTYGAQYFCSNNDCYCNGLYYCSVDDGGDSVDGYRECGDGGCNTNNCGATAYGNGIANNAFCINNAPDECRICSNYQCVNYVSPQVLFSSQPVVFNSSNGSTGGTNYELGFDTDGGGNQYDGVKFTVRLRRHPSNATINLYYCRDAGCSNPVSIWELENPNPSACGNTERVFYYKPETNEIGQSSTAQNLPAQYFNNPQSSAVISALGNYWIKAETTFTYNGSEVTYDEISNPFNVQDELRLGCTDTLATNNYDVNATVDDGTCQYSGCTLDTAMNYFCDEYSSSFPCNNDEGYTLDNIDDDGSCVFPPLAVINYEPVSPFEGDSITLNGSSSQPCDLAGQEYDCGNSIVYYKWVVTATDVRDPDSGGAVNYDSENPWFEAEGESMVQPVFTAPNFIGTSTGGGGTLGVSLTVTSDETSSECFGGTGNCKHTATSAITVTDVDVEGIDFGEIVQSFIGGSEYGNITTSNSFSLLKDLNDVPECADPASVECYNAVFTDVFYSDEAGLNLISAETQYLESFTIEDVNGINSETGVSAINSIKIGTIQISPMILCPNENPAGACPDGSDCVTPPFGNPFCPPVTGFGWTNLFGTLSLQTGQGLSLKSNTSSGFIKF